MVQNLTCVKSIIYNSTIRFSKVCSHINFFNDSCNQNVLKKSLDQHLNILNLICSQLVLLGWNHYLMKLHPYVSLKPLFEKKNVRILVTIYCTQKKKKFSTLFIYFSYFILFFIYFYSDDIISKTLNYVNLIIYMLYITYFWIFCYFFSYLYWKKTKTIHYYYYYYYMWKYRSTRNLI